VEANPSLEKIVTVVSTSRQPKGGSMRSRSKKVGATTVNPRPSAARSQPTLPLGFWIFMS
jgi:hypothetical protein